ncbi:MAG: GIY-YIG nuclease family protein [Chroococcales cyanobacterium]
MTTGIYQILNKLNGKSYIGQSRNIEKRWRQHTQGLEKSNALESGSYPLRAAFLKYGLKQFEFNIVEKCAEADLLIRENYWISQIKPEYNCNIWNPGKKK